MNILMSFIRNGRPMSVAFYEGEDVLEFAATMTAEELKSATYYNVLYGHELKDETDWWADIIEFELEKMRGA